MLVYGFLLPKSCFVEVVCNEDVKACCREIYRSSQRDLGSSGMKCWMFGFVFGYSLSFKMWQEDGALNTQMGSLCVSLHPLLFCLPF
jgi:hypothetical protein